MSRRFVNELNNGDNVDDVFLVVQKQTRANRQGNPYLFLELRDRTGSIDARLWNIPENSALGFNEGDYVHVRGKVQVFQGALQMIMTYLEPHNGAGIEAADFIPQSHVNPVLLLKQLREILYKINNVHLKALCDALLMDEELISKLMSAPAGIKNHHAYHGGLLEHVVTLIMVSHRILPFYPIVDSDLLVVGILLHDLGKVDELAYDRTYSYTDEGQLIGHLVMGVEMLTAKIKEAEKLTDEPFPTELALRLKHMIVSHHGTLEFGSPKVPMTPEALFLHHIDNLDAKLHAITKELEDHPHRDSTWTPYQNSLNRRLFKGSGAEALGNSIVNSDE
ncbi:MAG: OB-fold nucleic acid binding domain-containing protein [Planctomycetota bacterium]|nr:OB-fold nucleic acid binding domain-containing protein [Planctomycetota bacterium]